MGHVIEILSALFGIAEIILTVAVEHNVYLSVKKRRIHFSEKQPAAGIFSNVMNDHLYFLPRLLDIAMISRVSLMGYSP